MATSVGGCAQSRMRTGYLNRTIIVGDGRPYLLPIPARAEYGE